MNVKLDDFKPNSILTLLLRVQEIPLSEEAGEILACPGRVMVGFRGEHRVEGGGVVIGLVTGLIALGEMIPLLVVEAGRVQGMEEGGEVRADSGAWSPVTKFVEGREVEEVGRKAEDSEAEEVWRRVEDSEVEEVESRVDAREVEEVGMKVGRMLAGVLVSDKVCCTLRSCGGSCIMLLNACGGLSLLKARLHQ